MRPPGQPGPTPARLLPARLLPARVVGALLLGALLLGACADADPVGGAVGTGAGATAAPATTAPDGDPAADEATEDAPAGDQATEDVAGGSGAALPDAVTGTLGREDVEGGCISLTVDGTVYELVAAPGAAVVIDGGNGVIATTDGAVVASVGDEVTVSGAVDEGLMTFCQIGPVLAVGEVTAG